MSNKEKINISASVTSAVEAPHVSKSMRELGKQKIQEFMKEEMRLVKGIFKCFETPGATVKIIVKKYPGTQPFSKSMTDGETYEVPLYVARHLNGIDITAGALSDHKEKNTKIGTCSYAVHGFKWNPGNTPPMGVESVVEGETTIVPMSGVVKRVQRYGFQSLEFGGATT